MESFSSINYSEESHYVSLVMDNTIYEKATHYVVDKLNLSYNFTIFLQFLTPKIVSLQFRFNDLGPVPKLRKRKK